MIILVRDAYANEHTLLAIWSEQMTQRAGKSATAICKGHDVIEMKRKPQNDVG